MKLTRRQELAFINYGIEQFTENYIIGSVKDTEPVKKKHRKWSKEQHKKFSESMRKKWAERNK